MLLVVQSKCWGWKPFRLLDWSVDEPQFVDKLKEFWNEYFGKQDAKQLQLQLDIQRLERAGENRQLTQPEMTDLENPNSEN
ncbi:hypothetical protein DKX38_028699 [Salix brachista]|uniref:Uncharacterized protein n=1 Tax=Salix brachista TaxID=2182728 RepID=A0A5N5JBC9_9ROSI|nr:hypothetical protein DKX38_028699 [Salix brachista]